MGCWLWVQGEQESKLRVPVSLQYSLPDNLVSVDPLLTRITVMAAGPRAATRRAYNAPLQITVDLRDEGVGSKEMSLVGLPIEGLPSGVIVSEFSPSTLQVALDEKVKRVVQLEPSMVGEPAESYTVTDWSLEPSVIEVSGPKELLADMKAISTRPVDITGLMASTTFPAELDLPWGVETVEPFAGELSLEVESTLTVLTVSGVPVQVMREHGWVPAPGHEEVVVTLEGPTEVLKTLRTDRIFALVELPEDPSRNSYTARYQASRAPRMELVYPREDVVTVRQAPDPVEVVRKR